MEHIMSDDGKNWGIVFENEKEEYNYDLTEIQWRISDIEDTMETMINILKKIDRKMNDFRPDNDIRCKYTKEQENKAEQSKIKPEIALKLDIDTELVLE